MPVRWPGEAESDSGIGHRNYGDRFGRRLPNAGKHRHQRLGAALQDCLGAPGTVKLEAVAYVPSARRCLYGFANGCEAGAVGRGGAGSDGGRVRGAGVGHGRAQAPGGRMGPARPEWKIVEGIRETFRRRPHSQPRAVCGEGLACSNSKSYIARPTWKAACIAASAWRCVPPTEN